MKPSLRFKILNRDNFTCRYCGKKAHDSEIEVDHIIPRSKGGCDSEDNLITSCFSCNRGKAAKLLTSEELPKADISMAIELAKKAYKINKEKEKQTSLAIDMFLELAPHKHDLTPDQIKNFRSYVNKFPFDLIIESIEISIDRYIGAVANDNDYDNCIAKIGGILFNKTKLNK